jgi:hypothetical protein
MLSRYVYLMPYATKLAEKLIATISTTDSGGVVSRVGVKKKELLHLTSN